MDDEGDFKKARGFLLTYSALVLALWYFGADLTQFKLMGNEIKLHQRTESVWLVLAGINVYFWFRFYQRIPSLGLYFDEPMHDLYDHDLAWFGRIVKRRALKRAAEEHFAEKGESSQQMKVFWYEGVATGRDAHAEDVRQHGSEVGELHRLGREHRTKLKVSAAYQYTSKGEWVPFPAHVYLDYEPGVAVTSLVKAFTIVRGAFVTPWFTDHIAPLVFGLISTAFALWRWCDINFFTAALPHLAQSCAGVTH